jgi:hypothetical protein
VKSFSVVNDALDLRVYLTKVGFHYFISSTVWLGYLLLLLIPWVTERSLQRTAA